MPFSLEELLEREGGREEEEKMAENPVTHLTLKISGDPREINTLNFRIRMLGFLGPPEYVRSMRVGKILSL